jgi:fumarate hydratase subunit alpha
MNIKKFSAIIEKNLQEMHYELHPKIERCLLAARNLSIAEILLKNSKLAKEKKAPLCQDTGMVNIILQLSNSINLDKNIHSILKDEVERSYKRGKFRASVFTCPIERKELAYSPPIIQFEFLPKANYSIRLAILVRGGGAENSSRLLLLPPTSSPELIKEEIKKNVLEVLPYSCPPVIVGIGIGGSADYALYLAKSALIWSPEWKISPGVKLNKSLSAELEEKIREASRFIGAAAWGQGPTVAGIKVLTYPTHVGTLPVGIYIGCYATKERVINYTEKRNRKLR